MNEATSWSARELLARCLLEQERHDEAVLVLEAAPPEASRASWWLLKAQALTGIGRHADAISAAESAYRIAPESGPTLARTLAAAGEHERSIAVSKNWLKHHGDHAELWATLGTSSNSLGRSREAAKAFRAALRLNPYDAGANWGLGVALLRLGLYEEGFSRNEYRQKAAGNCRRLGVRPWRGESLAGKHLVVNVEQGFGDTVQFVRFLPLARRLARRTSLVVRPHTRRVFASNPNLGELVTGHPGFGFGDLQTLVMSLPHCLAISDKVREAPVPYLFPEPDLVSQWRARLPRGPKVALAWQGNPNFAGDPWRSMPFDSYAPVLDRFGRLGVSFLSLQKHFGREQLTASEHAHSVLDLGADIDEGGDCFVDSLAILSLVDVFLTTDTGLAHLAGAAGVATFLLLGQVADWRWGIDAERTVWYPSLRLFRQKPGEDWKGLVVRSMADLDTVITKSELNW